MQTDDRKQYGFTIVELLIAALIITVGILAWAKTQDGGIKANATTNGITTASEMAMSLAEDLALKSKSSPNPLAGSDTVTIRGIQFERTWSITQIQVMQGAKIFKIETKVNWNQYGAKEIQYQRFTNGN